MGFWHYERVETVNFQAATEVVVHPKMSTEASWDSRVKLGESNLRSVRKFNRLAIAVGLKVLGRTTVRPHKNDQAVKQVYYGLRNKTPMGRVSYSPPGRIDEAQVVWVTGFVKSNENSNRFINACIAAGFKREGITLSGKKQGKRDFVKALGAV